MIQLFTPFSVWEWGLIIFLAVILVNTVLWLGTKVMWSVSWLHDPVYVPTKDQVLADMLRLAKVKPREKAVDVGSGDGKVVIALAQAGAVVDGYEINPVLVYQARQKIKQLGLEKTARIYLHNFWTIDFAQYDVICLYTAAHLMPKLERLIRPQLKPKARVISNTFVFPTWPVARKRRLVTRYDH